MFPDLLHLGYLDSQAFILKGIRIPNHLHTSINPRKFIGKWLPSSLPFCSPSTEHQQNAAQKEAGTDSVVTENFSWTDDEVQQLLDVFRSYSHNDYNGLEC